MAAFFFGALFPLSFAPFHYWWLFAVSFAGLIECLHRCTVRKKALGMGFAYGLGFSLVGLYWLYIPIHSYGEASVGLSLLITSVFLMLIAGWLSLCVASWCYGDRLRSPLRVLCFFPLAWTFFEWIHATQLSGFPWLMVAYSQIEGPFQGLIPFLGDYGFAFGAGWCGATLWLLCRHPRSRVTAVAVSVVCISLIASYRFKDVKSVPVGEPLSVALVQGNIPQSVKWVPGALSVSLERYRTLSLPYLKSDLMIWPEAAIPTIPEMITPWLRDLEHTLKSSHATVLSGIVLRSEHGDNDTYSNAALLLGASQGRYVKQHLLPFGEYVPFESLLGKCFELFHMPMSRTVVEERYHEPLEFKGIKMGVLICYEVAFQSLCFPKQEANLWVVLSNDAWFNSSIAADQHLQMARYRARQTEKPFLFVSNDGYTALIDAQGQVTKQLPRFKATAVGVEVQPMKKA